MQIDGSTSLDGLANLFARGTFSTSGSPLATGSRFDASRAVLGDAFARASELGDSLGTLDQLLSAAEPSRTRRALAASASALNLTDNALTATTLRSAEEVNNTPTSFSPFGPDYTPPSGSTAPPTISGVYGSNLTGTVTFDARSNGEHTAQRQDNLRFLVYDPLGNEIDDIRIKKQDPLAQEYTLSNGLILTLGEGAVVKNDIFEVEVYANLGSVVDPDKAFNGVRNDNPNLEYGVSVTDGSFDVNGINITVNASDSINDVLGRINASAAGVTAVFDVATEQVILTRNTPGSAYDITLGNDDSGFLAATKLDTAAQVPGTDGNAGTRLSELPQFAAVMSGTFRVNNVDIALDVAVDTLEDVLARIEASGANVLASVINDRVFLEASHRKDSIILEGFGTGLFDALHIREGRYKPINRDGIALDSARAIAGNVREATAALERLLDSNYGGTSNIAEVANLQARVRGIVAAAEAKLADNTLLDTEELVTRLRVDFSALKAALIGETPDARDGFVRQLLDVVNQFTESLRDQVGSTGFLNGLSA